MPFIELKIGNNTIASKFIPMNATDDELVAVLKKIAVDFAELRSLNE